jgi:hypothetical protein
MNSNQLRCIINCDHELRHFISGVFARDQIPQYINQSFCGFISNTDTKVKTKVSTGLLSTYPPPLLVFSLTVMEITQLSMPRNLKTFQECFILSFGSVGHAVSEQKIF